MIEIKSIKRAALITGGLLLIPLLLQLMIGTGQDGQGFNWTPGDFVTMGTLIFVAGLALDLAFRKAGKYRIVAIAAVILVFLWLWAELAVGVFTNWGS